MRTRHLDSIQPEGCGVKPVDPERLILTHKIQPPPPSTPHHCLSQNKMNTQSDPTMRSTSVASTFSFLRQIPYTGPNIPSYWSLVIKVYKTGPEPLKGSDLVSCHPSSGRATSSSPHRRVVMKRGEVMGLRVLKGLEVLVSWGPHKAGDQNFFFGHFCVFVYCSTYREWFQHRF